MALQDYTTFSVSGADASTINVVSATQVDTDNRGNQIAYMHKNYGAGFFAKSVELDIEWELNLNLNNGVPGHFGLLDVEGTRETVEDGNQDAIRLESYSNYFRLFLYKNGNMVSDEQLVGVISTGNPVQYYMKLTHAAGANEWIVEVFSDANRTISLGTMTVSSTNDFPNLSVLQPSWTRGNSGSVVKHWSAYNLDIIKPAIGPPPPAAGYKLLLGNPF